MRVVSAWMRGGGDDPPAPANMIKGVSSGSCHPNDTPFSAYPCICAALSGRPGALALRRSDLERGPYAMPGYEIDILAHNRAVWDRQAAAQCEWSRPVGRELIAAARNGQWDVHLTPRPMPKEWLGDLVGKRILCLASAGGQQAPVLAAVGALVTVMDISGEQLQQDRMVAERDGLALATVQGDMCNLSIFPDAQFDLIFHPISNLYVPDVRPVWRECHRVLKSGGALLASFYNPVVFIGDRDPTYLEQGVISAALQAAVFGSG